MRFVVGLLALAGVVMAVPAAAQKQDKGPVVTLKAAEKARADAAPASAIPAPAITDTSNQWVLDLSTGGRVTILLRPDAAPNMVARIKTLTRQHFYDGLAFHRVIDGFMAQGGDPKGDGTGGSTLPNLKAEFNTLPHVRGAVAAARADDPDSANSQFFIVFQPVLKLDKKYTVFGRVISGMGFVDAIERGEPPASPSRVVHAYIASDNPPPYEPAPAATALSPTLPASGPGTKGAATVSAQPAAVSPAGKAPAAGKPVRKRK